MANCSTALLSAFLFGLLVCPVLVFSKDRIVAARSSTVVNLPEVPPAEESAAQIIERQLQEVSLQQPHKALSLHTSAGHLRQSEGQYEVAAQHYEAAKSFSARLADPEQLASSLASLGSVRYKQGRLLDARRELEKAHALASTVDRSVRANIAHSLGNVQRELGHYDLALRLYEEAQEFGLEGGLLDSDLGDTHARRGDLDLALESAQDGVKALRTQAQKSGRQPLQDPELAVALSVLGSVQHARGDMARAAEAYGKSLRSQRGGLRPGDRNLVATELRQARLRRDLGEAQEALHAAEDVAEALAAVQREGPELSQALMLQADLLRELHRPKEAEIVVARSFVAHERCCGEEDSPELAVLLHVFGSILHDQRRHSAALEKYERSLAMLQRSVGSIHPEVAAVHNSLGALRQDLGEDSAAQKHFRKCLEVQLQTVGPKSPEVSNTYNNLATVLARRGETVEAATLLKKALEVLDAAGVPASNPERLVYTENFAALNPRPLSI